MAKQDQLDLLAKGTEHWNAWIKHQRAANLAAEWSELAYGIDGWVSHSLWRWELEEAMRARTELIRQNARPDLTRALLDGVQLPGVDLLFSDLGSSSLRNATLKSADLRMANLERVDLQGANLSGANLQMANLSLANLTDADVSGADLSAAHLTGSVLVRTDLSATLLTGCEVYGASVWDIRGEPRAQEDLVIQRDYGSPKITFDRLEVAQFIYLMMSNPAIQHILNVITSKVVLILGRFTKEEKATLDALRDRLRTMDLIPVLFDFQTPASKDKTGTVETLARLARFVIADLTNPSSVPHELATVVPFLRTTPILTLRRAGSGGYTMFDDLRAYPWVIPTYEYDSADALIAQLPKVIAPAENMAKGFEKAYLQAST